VAAEPCHSIIEGSVNERLSERVERKVFDSRSSEAIALAVHFSAPIWVRRELLDKAGQAVPDPHDSWRL